MFGNAQTYTALCEIYLDRWRVEAEFNCQEGLIHENYYAARSREGLPGYGRARSGCRSLQYRGLWRLPGTGSERHDREGTQLRDEISQGRCKLRELFAVSRQGRSCDGPLHDFPRQERSVRRLVQRLGEEGSRLKCGSVAGA